MKKSKKAVFVYGAYENIGIEYLSAALKKGGYQTDLLFFPMLFEDSMLDIPIFAEVFSTEDRIIESYDFSDVGAVFFNVPTDWYRFFLRIAGKIKETAPDLPVVFGGIHPTSLPFQVLNMTCVDYVCVGEGDAIICDVMKYITGDSENIPSGLLGKENRDVFKADKAPAISDLDSLPFPDKKIFYKKNADLASTYTLFTTRGCPYSCTYCINCIWYDGLYRDLPRVRRRSVDDVIEELRIGLSEYNYRSVMFEDDVFVLSPAWHWEFIEKYRKYIDLPFVCVLHPKHCHDIKILESLKKAGCIQVEIGIQTLNSRVRKRYLNRYETNKDIAKALKYLHKAGLRFNVDHIAGLPDDNVYWQKKSLELYSRYRPNRILYFFITNYPGTEIEKIQERVRYNDMRDRQLMHEGLGETDETTGSVKGDRREKFEHLRAIAGWLPFLPHSLNRFLLDSGFYRFLPESRILTKIIPSILATLRGKEPRGEIILKKYVKGMLKRFL